MSVFPDAVQEELDVLARHFGSPITRAVTLGTMAGWTRRARPYEVYMVIRRRNGRLLTFTKTFYPPGLYRLPTGGMEPGERIADALLREVDEETGLDVRIVRFLAAIAYHAQDAASAPPRSFTFAFLLDAQGDTPAAKDVRECVAGYGDCAIADVPLLADRLDQLPDEDAPDLDDTWWVWGQFRAAHRVVYDALMQG